MAAPSFGAHRALLFCDDAAAKQTGKSLAAKLGFDAQDAGPLRQARLLERFALRWVSLAYGQGYGRDFDFQLLKR
jgi:8-hydroxy-5-deazaflavin:NADPH oxidoreductase